MSKQSAASTRLRGFISPAFQQLTITVNPHQMDDITDLVAGSMVGAGRFFHNPEHIIHVGSGGDAISVLSAFFHDLVYFQVDQGVGINVARHISPFIFEKDGELHLRLDHDSALEPFAQAVIGVFGYEPGQKLPAFAGQNEFLSALAAASVLSPHTNLSQIVQVAACIEATIPFRANTKGESAAQRLFGRLRTVNNDLELDFSDSQLKAMVRRAVKMANQDVSNFGGDSATRFLKNTWELVPEINPMLRSPSSHTIEGYREALQKMERFFANLDPMRVFQKFEGEPDEETYKTLSGNAARHVEEAQVYFRLKLISLAILEAMSGKVGKNLGLPILMGELSNLTSTEDRVEKFLPKLNARVIKDEMESRVLALLEKTDDEEDVGLKSSPLTAFLVRAVGFKALLKMWPLTEKFFSEKASAADFLAAFPSEAVGYVSDAVSNLLQSRAQKIATFVGTLNTKHAKTA